MDDNVIALIIGLGTLSLWGVAAAYWHLLQTRQRRGRQAQWDQFARAHYTLDRYLDRASRR